MGKWYLVPAHKSIDSHLGLNIPQLEALEPHSCHTFLHKLHTPGNNRQLQPVGRCLHANFLENSGEQLQL
jgi:hypothetical protein